MKNSDNQSIYFSAYWLRSSVVSVLASVITSIPPNWVVCFTLIFCGGDQLVLALAPPK